MKKISTRANDGHCVFCGNNPQRPFSRVVKGTLVSRCVGASHDEHTVKTSNAWAFVLRARKAGLSGYIAL